VNAIALLVGLLVLAYVGSILMGGRAIRGYGLPSGSEYVLLGLLLGPHALGVVERSTLTSLEPVAQVALGWLALVIGVDYGSAGQRRVSTSRLFAGLALALGCGVGVAAAFGAFAAAYTSLSGTTLLIACIGVGAVSCETTRYAVRWVTERYSAKGPLAELVADVSEADDVIPLVAITVAFAQAPPPGLKLFMPFWLLSLTTLGTGVVLGLISSALLRVERRTTETWGILLGTALLGIGTAARLGKSALGLCFALGLTISLLSGRRAELRRMISRTEHPVLLPVLVLAGAYVDIASVPALAMIGVIVLGARIATKWVSGALLRLSPAGRRADALLGFGLLSSGGLTMAFGLAFALRFDDVVGRMVLAIATIITLFGELVGPTSLFRALRRAGEIEAAPASRDAREAGSS
jgi:hypothetical protein